MIIFGRFYYKYLENMVKSMIMLQFIASAAEKNIKVAWRQNIWVLAIWLHPTGIWCRCVGRDHSRFFLAFLWLWSPQCGLFCQKKNTKEVFLEELIGVTRTIVWQDALRMAYRPETSTLKRDQSHIQPFVQPRYYWRMAGMYAVYQRTKRINNILQSKSKFFRYYIGRKSWKN